MQRAAGALQAQRKVPHRRQEQRNARLMTPDMGGFTGGFTAGAEDQTIVLQNVDLVGVSPLSDQQIIQNLLNNGKLITD